MPGFQGRGRCDVVEVVLARELIGGDCKLRGSGWFDFQRSSCAITGDLEDV